MIVKYFVLIILFFLTALLMPVKGVAMEKYSQFTLQVKENFKNINLTDGVSKEEAIIIAQYELIKGNDGGKRWGLNIRKPRVEESELVKRCWAVIFDANLKVRMQSGLKWYTFHIDKNTGEIKIQGWGPS